MTKHMPTVLAEASLFTHVAHARQAARAAALDAAEAPAKAELLAEGLPLTVRNIVTRQYAIVAREA